MQWTRNCGRIGILSKNLKALSRGQLFLKPIYTKNPVSTITRPFTVLGKTEIHNESLL